MRPLLILPALLLLAACSEQRMCISRATQDLNAVNRFIAEAEGNLSRGYALYQTQVVENERVACGTKEDGSRIYCWVPVEKTVIKRKAIDLDGEAAKLVQLRKKQSALAIQAQAGVEACKAAYPE
ncbi:MAG: hypothetical protein ABF285_11965 [Pacificibacter sp.]|uniref:hypothetical protein n=1 Tax=Pacificibacter sp. TaxID=1917866 RepID=UPI00321AFF35